LKRHSGLILGKNHPNTMQLRHTIKSESYLSARRLAWRTLEYPAPTPYASLGGSNQMRLYIGEWDLYIHIYIYAKLLKTNINTHN
jgi:hypothetical protein